MTLGASTDTDASKATTLPPVQPPAPNADKAEVTENDGSDSEYYIDSHSNSPREHDHPETRRRSNSDSKLMMDETNHCHFVATYRS